MVCRWWGGSNRLQTFVFAEAKIDDFISCPVMAAAWGNGNDGGARRAIWTEDGRWHLMAAVDDEGGGRSMAAGAFYVGNDGRL